MCEAGEADSVAKLTQGGGPSCRLSAVQLESNRDAICNVVAGTTVSLCNSVDCQTDATTNKFNQCCCATFRDEACFNTGTTTLPSASLLVALVVLASSIIQ